MNMVGRFICEKLCGHAHRDGKELLPDALRAQSHATANRAAEIEGVSKRIHRDVEMLSRLARLVEENRKG